MSTNKEYRKHPKGEDIMYRLSDIIDIIDDCKDDVRYLKNLEEVTANLQNVKSFCDEIINWINE